MSRLNREQLTPVQEIDLGDLGFVLGGSVDPRTNRLLVITPAKAVVWRYSLFEEVEFSLEETFFFTGDFMCSKFSRSELLEGGAIV